MRFVGPEAAECEATIAVEVTGLAEELGPG